MIDQSCQVGSIRRGVTRGQLDVTTLPLIEVVMEYLGISRPRMEKLTVV